ncbi:GNAT family N-acetyltransferase [Micromonospora sp. STR1_7]|uniref:GNAT family N-acetyltransferase n=1 Tax=Micromonospora parastrephiae TaxID=2806101 RepID=A0ABS1XNI4_9ACTN|nr:GNAT family N-acetyltransferase [Micromonospora parastrephiae]
MTHAEEAAAGADAAARAAGVRIRVLAGLDELLRVDQLFAAIWRPDPGNPLITGELLRALSKAGNYVAGAFDDTGMVGACVGFFGPPARRELHSHIAGVAPAALGRSVGWAMKLHQRAWCLRHGVDAVTWTFDPLVSRNAYFNVVKLGGVPVQYLTNFYGGMRDDVNGGDDTDRLLLRWELSAPQVRQAARGSVRRWDAAALRRAGAVIGLDRTPQGEPLPGRVDGDTILLAVPSDIQALRRTDPACARRWRRAMREAMGPLLADGVTVQGFDRAGWYVLTRANAEREQR